MPAPPSLIQMVPHFILSDQTLFQHPELFEFDYLPEQVLFRESQLAELAFQIRHGQEEVSPVHIICRGPSGCGKTTSVKHLFREIEEAENGIVPIYLNCQADQTPFAIYSRIYTRLFGMKPPRTGIRAEKLMNAIAEAVSGRDASLLICLDDLQRPAEHDAVGEALTSLFRMHEDFPECRTTVITTTSTMHLDLSRIVDSGIASTLRTAGIPFPPYRAEEIREILRLRIREGVLPGVISSGMLDEITRKTERAGDLRVGLDLLKRSVLGAMREGRSSVLREDILLAYGDARLLHLKKTVQELSEEERAILLLIHRMAERDGGGLISGELYGCLIEEEEISYPAFMNRLATLAELGLVDLWIRHAKGKMDVIMPGYSREEVEGICRVESRDAHSLKAGAESKSF